MKSRWTVFALGLVFSISLALVIGLRLSPEAMAVVIGVLAGVVASVPTSLIVAWFASRGRVTRMPMDLPARAPAEPRIVYLAAPPPGAASAMAGMAAFGAQSYTGYPSTAQIGPGAYVIAPALAQPRHFTVVGGADLLDEVIVEEPGYTQEVVTWQR